VWPRCAALSVGLWSATAAAQNNPAVVDVAIAAAYASDAAAIREDLEEVLARAGVEGRYRQSAIIDAKEVLQPDPKAPAALARVWLDLAAGRPDRAVVYLADSKWQRVLVRQVVLSGGIDEVTRQEVSLIVASSVEAMRSGAALTVGREGDVILEAEAAPFPTRGRGLWIAVGAVGGAERWSQDTLVPALGFSLTLGLGEQRLAPAVWISGAYNATTSSQDPVSLRFRGGVLSALALAGRAGRRAALRAGAGAAVQLTKVEPLLEATPSEVTLDPPHWVPGVSLRAAVRADYRLTPAALVFLALIADVQVAQSRYFVQGANNTQTVFQPSWIRPSLMVGLEASILEGKR
jgi:hypothetical protein